MNFRWRNYPSHEVVCYWFLGEFGDCQYEYPCFFELVYHNEDSVKPVTFWEPDY